MGRIKKFSRESVLEKAMPVFWKHGLADASLQELERATGVNKSGLYAEFEDKNDLFVQSLEYYLEQVGKRGVLTAEPLGWGNIERFLKAFPCGEDGQNGCFAVYSIRELAILPPKAVDLVKQSRVILHTMMAKNVAAENPRMDADALAELVLVFMTGLSVEQNLQPPQGAKERKVDNFLGLLREA